jgi:hypothetical protein
MSNAKAAKLRNAAYHDVLAILEKLPENERFYLLNRIMVGMNPEAIPVKVDARRMSTEEARRRLALRSDRVKTKKRSARPSE